MKLTLRATGCLIGSFFLLVASVLFTPLVSAQGLMPTVKVSHTAPTTKASTCLQPSFNPKNILALSDAQLLAMGLPSRAAIRQNPAHWSQVLAHIG